MRKQQQIWEAEHANQGTLPTVAQADPASGVIYFVDYLKDKLGVQSGRIVDIGAEKGR